MSWLPPDPVVRRVAGLVLVVAAAAILVAFRLLDRSGPPYPASFVVVGVSSALGALGLSMVIRATRRNGR
jgi:Trk-type K+ transport system membrane component